MDKTSQDEERHAGGDISAASPRESVIIPGAALLLCNIVLYAAMVSFAIRPNPGERMIPIGGIFGLGIFAGGAFFPAFYAWTTRKNRWIKMPLAALWLLSALLSVLPGLEHYVYNAPLRLVANLAFGMQIAPVYTLFFSRFPMQWRGTCLGVCLGAGLFCHNLLISWANSADTTTGAFHPLLGPVFYIHAGSIALLAALCIYAFLMQQTASPQPYNQYPSHLSEPERKNVIRLVSAIALLIYCLSGILEARLTPTIATSPSEKFSIALTILAGVAAPVAGWLLDKKPDMLFQRILPFCCWLFVLTPSMIVLGYGNSLHNALQSLTAMAQFCFFIVCTLTSADMAKSIGKAVWYACCIYAFRLAMILVYIIWSRVLGIGPGTTVLVGAGMAYLVSRLTAKVKPARETPQPENGAPARRPLDTGTITGFIDSADLTPRERETAVLLMENYSMREISESMGISERTVKKHTTNIYQKFGVGNRRELLRHCVDRLSDQRESG